MCNHAVSTQSVDHEHCPHLSCLWDAFMHPLPLAHRLLEWLNANSPAVQAIATVALVLITGYYAVTTHHFLKQARQSAEAAKAQADATQRQARAAENSIAFMKQQHDEQLRLPIPVVLAAIASTERLIEYWKGEAARRSHRIADPDDLGDSPIRAVLSQTRSLPAGCEKLFIDADAAMRAAKYALQKLQGAIGSEAYRNTDSDQASAALVDAENYLASARVMVERHIEADAQTTKPGSGSTAV